MDIGTILLLIMTGVFAGLLSGSMGVGGAVVVIPMLVFVLGMTQKSAQGTSLAFMIPPVGILAAINYWKEGYVNWKYAAILALSFMIGAYFGSEIAMKIPEKVMTKIFGVFLLLISLKMIVGK